MYIDFNDVQRQLNNIAGTDFDNSDLLELQKIEDLLRTAKTKAAAELQAKRNQFNLDSFLELLARTINTNLCEMEYYYFISRHYDYIHEISEKKKAFITFIGNVMNVNNSSRPAHTSAVLGEVDRLLRENIDFLFLCSDDDTFIADMVKTPNEIILPYGNSIKYVRGARPETYERAMRLAVDTSNALGFPVTLKLRP